jgi:hypothetical protein
MFAGWYPDESGLPFERYWDGTHWTADVRPLTAPAAPPSGYPLPTTPLPFVPAPRQPWYRRRGFVISGAVIGAIIVISAIASAVAPKKSNSPDTNNAAVAVQTPSSEAPKPPKHHVRRKAIQSRPTPKMHTHTAKTRPANDAPDDGSWVMPNEIGNDLQAAQDDLQRVSGDPIFFSHSHDLLGDRFQILDSDWQVCNQNVAPGERVSAVAHVDFGVVKVYESCP